MFQPVTETGRKIYCKLYRKSFLLVSLSSGQGRQNRFLYRWYPEGEELLNGIVR